jgi:uncharacterized iron-regulated membrane protein
MATFSVLRKSLTWTHLWLGLIGGLFFCLLGVTGTIVTFRPQIASLLSPPGASGECRGTVNWNRAQQDIESVAGSTINRIYFPDPPDPRYHFRMRTGVDAIYTHVIYDACARRVLGVVSLQWMDWLVDLHHNLLAGRTGRQVAGAFGLALFLSGIGGLALVVLSRPSLRRLFRVDVGPNVPKTMFDLHRAVGVGAAALLLLQSFTALWLCYPQAMRMLLGQFASRQAEARSPRAGKESHASPVGLGELILASERAIPDGRIREIRMPDGNGNVQVRMWRAGDFRSLGNNVVSLDRVSARVMGVDLYAGKPGSSRWIQAMAGLHYGEWGGIAFRTIYGVAGLATVPLFGTGVLYWWLRGRRSVTDVRRASISSGARHAPIADRV